MLVCLIVATLAAICFSQVPPNCPAEDTGMAVIYPDSTDCTYVKIASLYPSNKNIRLKMLITIITFNFHLFSKYYMCSWGTAVKNFTFFNFSYLRILHIFFSSFARNAHLDLHLIQSLKFVIFRKLLAV